MDTTHRIASTTALLLASLAAQPTVIAQTPSDSMQALKAKLQTTLNRHLNKLLSDDGSVVSLKGKTADGSGALAFYLMFEITGEQKFRKAALSLADQVLKDMRAMKFGVLPIKEKDKPNGEKIIGGGPPITAEEGTRTFRTSLNTLGDGFVEAIADGTLISIAAKQKGDTHQEVHGLVINVPVLEANGRKRVGRFGWKNQHASLLSFSGDAYLNEIGITNFLVPDENTSLGRFVGFGTIFDIVPDNTP